VALVRVYCGLASADTGVAGDDGWLTAAVVDDAGRLLDVCEIGDDAQGYATLNALLAERSSAPAGVAVAADSDDHLVTMLLTTAGRALAVVDDDAADDYAERFADDESPEEIESAPAERRAVGLARALQAGALSAHAEPAPRDLVGLKPVLSAHAAMTHGRHGAAGALREVLRELYPAALRAYPDPAERVALAVLDLLPEPSQLTAPTSGRNRDTGVAVEAVAGQLAAAGVCDHASAVEAVTSLRVAIAETPRRGGISKHLTAAVGETVRQAIAAVNACDAACNALIATVADRVAAPAAPSKRKAPVKAPAVTALRPVREPVEPPRRRGRTPLQPVSASPAPLPPGFEPTPISGVPIVQPAMAQAAMAQPVLQQPAVAQPAVQPPVMQQPVVQQPVVQQPAPRVPQQPVAQPQPVAQTRPVSAAPVIAHQTPQPQPVQPPVATPQPVPSQRTPLDAPLQMPVWNEAAWAEPAGSPADSGMPFVPTLSQAAISSARAERRAATADSVPNLLDEQGVGIGATEVVLPLSRPAAPEPEMPGSRSSWPLVGDRDDRDSVNGYSSGSYDKVTPPWLADDMVTPPWLTDDLTLPEPPPLRLVDGSALDEPLRPRPRRSNGEAPLDDDGDGDLLIFSTIRSAWFTGHSEEIIEEEPTWNSAMDVGWQAAEHASSPSFGEETRAGLPKRVPQANLVPGSPIAAPERPLRIVRDPQRLAQHTSGYFRGWRKGQEVNGYAVGGRPGRESAGGWDFSRDHDDRGDDYGYRTAGYGR
jgi:hypothetical protein